jgi:predicted AlkP superfamily phosphohydrolase/phosphomutase
MFICALERFSDQICIENLAGIKLKGTNIKMHSIFCFSQFTITLFLNPFIRIKPYENVIRDYYSDLFEKYVEEFKDILKFSSNDFTSQIELKGREWLRELNELYLNSV